MAVIVPIVSKFDANGVQQAEKQLTGLSAITAATGNAFRSAFLPATIALGGITAGIIGATEAAIADAAAQDALARQLQVSTGATDAQVAAVEDYISAQSRLTATADDELRPALAQLVRATGDVARAQKLLGLAQDIAAGTGRDLQTVTLALSKATTGQVGALTRLGVPLDKAAVKSKNLDAITAQLANTFGGAAQRQAQTAEGRIRGFGIAIDEAKESIGAGLLPIISALLPVLQRVADFLTRNTKAVVIATASIASLAAAIIAVNLVMRAYTAIMAGVTIATRAFDLVVKASPLVRFGLIIGAVIAALAALQATSRDVAKALQVFGRVTVTIIGGVGAAVAMFSKSIAAGAYLAVKAVEQLAKVSDFVFRRDDAKKIRGVSDAIDRAGQGLDRFERASLKFANANVNFPAVLDRSAKAIKGVQVAASARIPGADAGTFPALEAVGNAATKSAANAAEKVKKATEKVSDAAKRAQEAGTARVKAATDRFRDAFSDYADRGFRAFDAETSRLIDQVGAKLERDLDGIDRSLRSRISEITAYYTGEIRRATNILTAPSTAEIELRRLEALRDEERAARDLRDAQLDLDRVRVDATSTADDVRRAEERLADVVGQQAIDKLRDRVSEEARLRDEQIEKVTATLEEARDREISFAEQAAEDQRVAARARAAEREKELAAERDLERENLERRLGDIETSLEREPALWQNAHQRILALFADSFGPDYERAGQSLGDAFARGLSASLGRVTGAAGTLNTIRAETLGGPARASALAPELNLIVNAGIGTNGAAVGNSIVNALQDWQRRNGALPLRVSGY
jgi:hypothetical protein